MNEIVYCKDCKHFCYGAKVENDRLIGKQCRLGIIDCPELNDFCSKGVKVLKCPKCDKRYDELPNFCSKCGEKLIGE